MVPAPPLLPTQFPCWCRAIYSWGGESKRDLGFIEGDLIECLNAGDGSWWVGRLYRDRRTVGSFPSNFVEVLPDGFRPAARSASPMPDRASTSPRPMPSKSKTFRKPFEAYAKAPHYTSAKQPETFREPPKPRTRETSDASYPRGGVNHASTPPPSRSYESRAPSPMPSPSPSPVPFVNYEARVPSDDGASPPPPPPPPHRHIHRNGPQDIHSGFHAMARHGSTASNNHYRQGSDGSCHAPHYLSRHPSHAGYEDPRPHTPRVPSPRPPSPAGSHMTPSPLREAMDGVMEQLGQLGGLGEGAGQEPQFPDDQLASDPWSPESFDMVTPRSRRAPPEHARPMTSMGIAHHDEGYETWSGETYQGSSHQSGPCGRPHELHRLNSYVQRMEKQLQNQGRVASPEEPIRDMGPPPPPKGQHYDRPKTSSGEAVGPNRMPLRARKSAYEVGRGVGRTYTTRTTVTNASSGNQSNASASTQSSGRTLWSGTSASAFSAASAGSFARTHTRAQSALGMRELDMDRPGTPFTGVTYHSSHASNAGDAVVVARPASQAAFHDDLGAGLGGLVQPKAPKRNIFKKMFESAKTGVASNRNSVTAAGMNSASSPTRSSPFSRSLGQNSSPISSKSRMNGPSSTGRERDNGPGSGVDWVQVRRDVNRSNSLSKIERDERRDRCQMMDYPALEPVDELLGAVEGDEGADGMPVMAPLNYQAINFSQVDKNSRFIGEPSPMMTAATLATSYVCRPYRSDVQRLRAIFTWVAERICWEQDAEGPFDSRRVIETKRACAEEYAALVMDMCCAAGLECEMVRGFLKSPGDVLDPSMAPRSNHWWNAVLVDGEWRMMDCCLASPSNPKRGLYSSAGAAAADFWWFLTRPSELCWTHVPEHHDQQHMVPPAAHDILLNLPCACPAMFRHGIELVDFNTAATRIEDLEMVHIKLNVPADVEVVAEVEARALCRDSDGDVFESGDRVRKRALAQAEWTGGVKRYVVKALLPGDEGQGTLNIYAGKRGLMHSIKDIPHPLALALPVVHTGENPPYEFVTRHPTPHAQRHDIYVVQPQCQRLALNNTFVFAIRQHPSSPVGGGSLTPASNPGTTSPVPYARPSSAMSIAASSVSNPSSSASGTVAGKKPAKLAIQTPGGKILRLMRKEERRGVGVGIGVRSAPAAGEEAGDGGTWETIIKCSERGLWRGLVLADRTARWCVFAEWARLLHPAQSRRRDMTYSGPLPSGPPFSGHHDPYEGQPAAVLHPSHHVPDRGLLPNGGAGQDQFYDVQQQQQPQQPQQPIQHAQFLNHSRFHVPTQQQNMAQYDMPVGAYANDDRFDHQQQAHHGFSNVPQAQLMHFNPQVPDGYAASMSQQSPNLSTLPQQHFYQTTAPPHQPLHEPRPSPQIPHPTTPSRSSHPLPPPPLLSPQQQQLLQQQQLPRQQQLQGPPSPVPNHQQQIPPQSPQQSSRPHHRPPAPQQLPPIASQLPLSQAPRPAAQQDYDFINPQDILQASPPPPIAMGINQSSGYQIPEPTPADDAARPQSSIPVKSPPATSHPALFAPLKRPEAKFEPPRIKSSPRSSVSNSPALSARSPSLAKKSPAIPSKPSPVNTGPIMVAIAEECLDKARSAVHDVAMSLHPERVDEYQRLIVTSLSCLEATLQNCCLSPREEARVRLRYASTLQEETENLMEAEMALGKGITLCDKHRLVDLKYCMQYSMLKVLFQRNHKAALKAVDGHISDCQAFKHIQWYYAFRLLKSAFYMEMGSASDAGAVENIRSVQLLADVRGDKALSVFAYLFEGLIQLKTCKDGNIERVQACLAQAAKFQFNPAARSVQLDVLALLLDFASSLHHQSAENTAQKLRLLQKRLDECDEWHNAKAEFLVPIKKQPSNARTVSEDTTAIVRAGDGDSPYDYLVMSFVTKVELRSLVFTFSGLANMHKSVTQVHRSTEYWREGLRILETWDDSTANIPYGPPVSLATAIRQRVWRIEAQAYLNALLGLMMSSQCQWGMVKQILVKLGTLVTATTQPAVQLLSMYLTGVYHQGIGDLQGALHIFLDGRFAVPQKSAGVKTGQREIALLAGLNRLWIMQHPSCRNDRETRDLVEQLQPHCASHWNVDVRIAWHNAVAALETDPPQQLNQQKQHIQAAVTGSKSNGNVLGSAVTLCIMRSRLFENVIGEQALKSARAASKQAQRSGNILWQSVADGMLAQSYEVQGQRDESRREWEKATKEAREAFSGTF
ncbi:hypothetical protein CP533_5113 [Ophiocordyceps camponoti-saundersi (nom. inval.)]|nr:hypothetical protein CP533_5113 [Ophiocordyceps camponoti-saundersi (nom. inval.)]